MIKCFQVYDCPPGQALRTAGGRIAAVVVACGDVQLNFRIAAKERHVAAWPYIRNRHVLFLHTPNGLALNGRTPFRVAVLRD